MLTTVQVRNKSKIVTRRLGWKNVKPGERLQAVVKCQGLKPGEKVQKLCVIEVISVKREPLIRMIQWKRYGFSETKNEGFPNLSPKEFVAMFCHEMKCDRGEIITRIEFKYV